MRRRPPPRERLEQLLAEARQEPLRPLELHSVRERLREEFDAAARKAQLDQQHTSQDGRSRSGAVKSPAAWPWLGGALALCAVIVAAIAASWLSSDWRPLHVARNEPPAAAGWVDGRTLVPGQPLVASEDEVHVEHPQRASWTLAPGSQARIVSVDGAVLRIALDRGSLEANVRPSQLPESFVVQALGTEVSVHGTRFIVTVDATGQVGVSVSEGEVRVRPGARLPSGDPGAAAAEGDAPEVALRAGMSGRFRAGTPVAEPEALRLSRARGAKPDELSRVPESAVPAAQRHAARDHKAQARDAAPAASPAPGEPALRAEAPMAGGAGAAGAEAAPEPNELPKGLPLVVVERAVTLAKERIQGCFVKHTSKGELTIEALTELALEVEPSGAILEVRMNPPLAPAVDECVARELATLNVGASESGFHVERQISLSR